MKVAQLVLATRRPAVGARGKYSTTTVNSCSSARGSFRIQCFTGRIGAIIVGTPLVQVSVDIVKAEWILEFLPDSHVPPAIGVWRVVNKPSVAPELSIRHVVTKAESVCCSSSRCVFPLCLRRKTIYVALRQSATLSLLLG